MKIVIVEDDEWKADQLRAFVESTLPKADIRVARSVNDGVRNIIEGVDLAIIDMSLPSFGRPGRSGGRPQGFGGREILSQMRLREIGAPAILVTQYGEFEEVDRMRGIEEIDLELKQLCPENYRGYVLFSATVTGWQAELAKLIDFALGGLQA